MMIRITDSCCANCIHCGNSAVKTNNFMTMDIFKKAIEWSQKHETVPTALQTMMITGGEPFEHPDIINFLHYISDFPFGAIIITTNGHGLTIPIMNKFPKFLWQISYDEKVYPCRPAILNDPELGCYKNKIMIADKIMFMYPKGRALKNIEQIKEMGYEINPTAPKCLNIRNLVHNGCTFQEAIDVLRSIDRQCIPVVDYDGSIRYGEWSDCGKCGSIFDSDKIITDKILHADCHTCDFIFKTYEKARFPYTLVESWWNK